MLVLSCLCTHCVDVVAFTTAYFGQGSGPVHLDNIHCTGVENGLLNCTYNDQPNCGHSSDAGVRCAGIKLRDLLV